MFRKILLLPLLALTLLQVSCSGYNKILKSTDNTEKFEAAVKYYHDGDYNRALQLFDQLIPFYRGTDKAEMINYYTANSYFHQGDYILANYYFKTFTKNFPNSNLAEECLYQAAFCKYLESPMYSLDQTSTLEAIQEFQMFVNLYPTSERITLVNQLMDELRAKLEKKSYEIARLYYNMGEYQAAITSFRNVYKDFPDTRYKEELLYLTLKAYVDFAANSVPSKKKERYQGAIEAYNTLVTFYPNTAYLKDADQLKKSALKEVEP